jgi:toxin ParE1/3/4
MSGLQFTPEAAQDLDEIDDYLAQNAPASASRIMNEIEQRCRTVSQFPGLGRARDDLRPGLRSFPSGKYVIFFRVGADGRAQIVRVLHGKRDFDAIFNP